MRMNGFREYYYSSKNERYQVCYVDYIFNDGLNVPSNTDSSVNWLLSSTGVNIIYSVCEVEKNKLNNGLPLENVVPNVVDKEYTEDINEKYIDCMIKAMGNLDNLVEEGSLIRIYFRQQTNESVLTRVYALNDNLEIMKGTQFEDKYIIAEYYNKDSYERVGYHDCNIKLDNLVDIVLKTSSADEYKNYIKGKAKEKLLGLGKK